MAEKRKRVPLSEFGRKPLQEPPGLDKKKYHYHWINDAPGGIDAAKAAGYTPVTSQEKQEAGSLHSDHSIVGNPSSGQRQVLMKLPIELYEEDQKLLEQRNDAVDDAIARQEFDGKSIENVYTPDGGGIKSHIKHTTE